MTIQEAVQRLIARFRSWWLPFYFGPPCKYGSYARGYCGGVLMDRCQCRIETDRILAELRGRRKETGDGNSSIEESA